MKKILLILVLCSPLGWVAWTESGRLLNDWRSPVVVDTYEDESKSENAALNKAKEKADEVLKLSDELVRSAVTLEDPPESSESGTIARELVNVGRSRKEHRKYVEKVQDEAADLVANIENNLSTLRGEDGFPRDVPKEAHTALLGNLAAYEKLDVRDTDRIDSAKAQADWPKLDRGHPGGDLDLLYEQLDRWTPEGPGGEVQTADTVKSHADAYRVFLDSYGKVKGSNAALLVKEARERYELWHRGAALVGVIKDRKAPVPDRSPTAAAGRVRTVAEEAAAENPPEKFVTTARRLARVLCGDMLPEEKLDEKIALNDGGAIRQIPRASLGIIWKDGSAVTTLDKSRFNEFNLKVADVSGFVYNNESFDLPSDNAPPLTPTDYSKAVNAYNEERARVKRWSGEDLARLRTVCEQYRDVLGGNPKTSGKTLLDRIDALNNVVRRYPALFSNDSN